MQGLDKSLSEEERKEFREMLESDTLFEEMVDRAVRGMKRSVRGRRRGPSKTA
jgi:hypothetical protein